MPRRFLVLWTCALLVVLATACGSSTPVPSGAASPSGKPSEEEPMTTLRMHGSNTIGSELAPALLKAFFESNGAKAVSKPGDGKSRTTVEATAGARRLRGEVEAEGTAAGFKALAEGKTDIVLASRRILPEEREDLIAKGIGDLTSAQSEHVIGLDAVALIVHTGNPVHALSLQQAREVFAGKTKNWKELGGLPEPIAIYSRGRESGTYDTFRLLVLGGEDIASDAPRWVDSDDLATYVASDKTAIGFVGFQTS